MAFGGGFGTMAAGVALAGVGAFEMWKASTKHREQGADAFTADVGGRFVAGTAAVAVGAGFGMTAVPAIFRTHGAGAGALALGTAVGALALGAYLGAHAVAD